MTKIIDTHSSSIDKDLARHWFNYDPFTGIITWKKAPKHCSVLAGDEAGCIRTDSGKKYRYVGIKGGKIRGHNLAYLIFYGALPKGEIDHIDGNGLNNKLENLRDVTHYENGRNMRLHSTNTSGISGVSWDKNNSAWACCISDDRKRIFLGRSADFFEACCLRKSAEVMYKYHKNHGKTRSL